MSTSAIYGRGMLFVRSRISPSVQDLLTEPTFISWYDNEHIPQVVSTSCIHSALRYVDINKSSPAGDAQNPKPFLACYPMEDLAFTLGDEFKKIGFRSSMLPGSGVIYDLADMDVSYLGLIGMTTSKKKTEKIREGQQYIITLGIRSEKQMTEKQVTAFFQRQVPTLEQTPQYTRTLHLKLLYARTNAQSRALKGLPTTDEPHPEPSTWLVIHEFTEVPDEGVMVMIMRTLDGSMKKAVEEGGWGATESEMHVWRLDCAHGEGKFFDE